MKVFSLRLLTLIVFGSVWSIATAQQTITFSCDLKSCSGSLALYRFNGTGLEEFQKPTQVNDSVFQFAIPKTTEPIFYYIGERKEQVRPILLGTEKSVKLSGNCTAINRAIVTNSLMNDQYEQFKNRISYLKRETTMLSRKLQAVSATDTAEAGRVAQRLKALDVQKLHYMDSLKQTQPYFAKIAALDMYISYDAKESKYPTEVEYFANEYFQFADFKDKTYNKLPWVYEAFRVYTSTLTQLSLPEGAAKNYLEKHLQKMPKGGETQMTALGGILVVLRQQESPDFSYFAKQYIAAFKEEMPQVCADLQKQVDALQAFIIGGVAPDFAQKTPEGQDIKLSELRGKVVLIDFWASWCGPCRRENPNVVRVYNQYKDKGFEILGVSLDNAKDRWLQAIQQDGLTWMHVSDLKGWSNAVAQTYGVRSIPQTILLDAEGKIIARNLRGPSLEEKLAEIFK